MEDGWMDRWIDKWMDGRKAGRWSYWQPEIENIYLSISIYLLSSMAP